MEIKGKHTLQELVQKIGLLRLIILVLAGIMLLVLSFPQGEKTDQETVQSNETTENGDAFLQAMYQYAKKQEEATEKLLSKVDGIGKVQVMLTLASSEEKVTLQDDTVSDDDSVQSDKSGSEHKTSKYQSSKESVLVKRDGTEVPYVVQIQSPVVEGVVVVAQGADSSQKEMEIIEAVQALFPVQSHKIKVMKME